MDYAVNRFYNSAQGRFNQVDPIGMGAVSLSNPQSLNLYGYCENDPVNSLDPDGLFLGKLFGWIGGVIKNVAKVFAVVLAVAAVLAFSFGYAAIGVAALIGSGIYATIGWGSGKLSEFAGAFLGTLGKAGNFRTPNTFPVDSGVSGVNNYLAKKKQKPKVYDPAKVAKFVDYYLYLVKGAPNAFQNRSLNESITKNNRSGLDDRIIKCQAAAESGYNANAVGGAGEIGLLQIKPDTAEGLGFDSRQLKNPEINIRVSTLYLGQLNERFGNARDALVAYNAGPRRFREGRASLHSFEYADQILGCAKKLGYN
jgi:RHS repeat-associated protein